MKILFFVNKFDKKDDLLGFFPGWIDELLKKEVFVSIITQKLGEYDSHPNLKVSLIDKENKSKISRVVKLAKLLFKFRKDYDSFFVIMAPAWASVAALPVKILGKKLYLWYAVWKGSFKLRVASLFCDKIFSSVPGSFPFKTKKLVFVGQGIDTDYFVPDYSKQNKNKLLFLGRISPVKKIEIFFEAINLLKERGFTSRFDLRVDIVGGIAKDRDVVYLNKLKKQAQEHGIDEIINWHGKAPHIDALGYYQGSGLFVNMTPAGSFDKAMLEAMACGVCVVASNPALGNFFSEEMKNRFIFKELNPRDMALKIENYLIAEDLEVIRDDLRRIVVENHSQKQWVQKLLKNL